MLNIVGFLLVLLVALLCQKSGGMSNHLLDFGMLALFGTLFGELAKHLRLPAAAGFVIAGILLGNNGLGVIGTTLTTDTSMIENIIFMVLVAHLAATACTGLIPGICIRNMLAGILTPVVIVIVGMGIFSLAHVPFRTGMLYSLCAATSSPALNTALIMRREYRQSTYTSLFTAFAVVFVGWSLFAAADRAFSGNNLRLALMPLAIAATSVVAGIVWGLAVETFLPAPSHRYRSAFFALVLFLAYPIMREGSLDLLFFAIGFGMYDGLFNAHPSVEPDFEGFLALIIFTLFGTRLALGEVVKVMILPGDAWRLVALLAGTIVLGRVLARWIARKLTDSHVTGIRDIVSSLAYGPMALIVFHRFIPAFVLNPMSETEQLDYVSISVIITTMLLFATSLPIILGLAALIPSSQNTHPIDNT